MLTFEVEGKVDFDNLRLKEMLLFVKVVILMLEEKGIRVEWLKLHGSGVALGYIRDANKFVVSGVKMVDGTKWNESSFGYQDKIEFVGSNVDNRGEK